MTWLSDAAVERLKQAAAAPDAGGRYEIAEAIGRGGMGTVYLAHDRELQRPVALKVLRPDVMADSGVRMLREARIIAGLEHPGIVPIHDVGTLPDGRIFYAMKRVSGNRLDELVRPDYPLADRLRIFERICEAVAFAHARGVIHRDLKPQNVMVGAFGEVLVMDWGIAKLLAEAPSPGPSGDRVSAYGGVTAHGTILGTPGYMAPEQASGGSGGADERADVYSLGALLQFLVAGSPVPKRLAAVYGKAMAEAREDRYASVAELAADARAFMQGDPVRAYPERPLERLFRLASRYRTPLLLVAAYLAMRVLLILLSRG